MSISKHDNPIDLFRVWFEEGQHCGQREPTALCLSTCDAEGFPSSRMVLL